MARSDDKRQDILRAAMDEFQAQGFEGARMDRVAERAGVSKRTVYNHFDSKEALFGAIAEIAFGMMAEVRTIAYDPDRPLRPQLIDLGRAEGRLLANPEFMRLARVGVAEILRSPETAERLGLGGAMDDGFETFFAAAAEAGAIRPDAPVLAARQFMHMIKGQAYWPALFSGQVVGQNDLAGIIETSADSILASFAMPGHR